MRPEQPLLQAPAPAGKSGSSWAKEFRHCADAPPVSRDRHGRNDLEKWSSSMTMQRRTQPRRGWKWESEGACPRCNRHALPQSLQLRRIIAPQPSSFLEPGIASKWGQRTRANARCRARRFPTRPARPCPGSRRFARGSALRTGLRTGTSAAEAGGARYFRTTAGLRCSSQGELRRCGGQSSGTDSGAAVLPSAGSSRLRASAGSSGWGAACSWRRFERGLRLRRQRRRARPSPAAVRWRLGATRAAGRESPGMPAARSQCCRTTAALADAAYRRKFALQAGNSSGTGSERSRAKRCSSRPQAAAGSTAACGLGSSTAWDFGAGGALAGSTFAGGALATAGAGLSTRLGSVGAIATLGRVAGSRAATAGGGEKRVRLPLFVRHCQQEPDYPRIGSYATQKLTIERRLITDLVLGKSEICGRYSCPILLFHCRRPAFVRHARLHHFLVGSPGDVSAR